MKNNRFLNILYQLASPIAVTLLGLLLVISPDSASVLIARVLGWGLTIVGIGFGIAAIIDRDHAVRKGITAVAFACAGGTLSANPLLLAAWIGRIIGVLIAIRGVRDLLLHSSYGYSRYLALITTAVGVLLVVLFIGIGMLVDRLKSQKYLPKGDDSIIDAL